MTKNVCKCSRCGDLYMSVRPQTGPCRYCAVLRDIDLALERLDDGEVRLAS